MRHTVANCTIYSHRHVVITLALLNIQEMQLHKNRAGTPDLSTFMLIMLNGAENLSDRVASEISGGDPSCGTYSLRTPATKIDMPDLMSSDTQ